MGKQRTLERIGAGEDTIGRKWAENRVPDLFREHYQLAVQSMSPTHAAANAHDAVQRHLDSLEETEAGDGMR